MNRTQMGAWFTLTMAILLGVFGVTIVIEMVTTGTPARQLIKVWLLLIPVFTVVSVILLRRKERPAEVDSDERDKLIKKNAVLVAFVAVWILLVVASVGSWFAVGDDGSIPGCLLPLINMGVFLDVMIIYAIAILVQYRRGGKDGQE
ncbi:MAG: hypothetical protein H8E73_03120 [Planctomycetes bacterium]|nr:hypothetical protein [Planctomycetota bacterium]